jgi:glutathione S-transferase
VAYQQSTLSGFDNRADVRVWNPLGRIPALVLDSGDVLIDSGAIIDHLDEAYGGEEPLTPRSGPDRRAVLKTAAIMMGACDKGLQAAYTRNHTPREKQHQPWIDDCIAQVTSALESIDAIIDPAQPYFLFGRLTQADITSVVTERLARVGLGIDTGSRMPRLRTLTNRLSQELPFHSTEP